MLCHERWKIKTLVNRAWESTTAAVSSCVVMSCLCKDQECKLSIMCRNSSTVYIVVGPFRAGRHFVWVSSGMLRLFGACSFTFISLSE